MSSTLLTLDGARTSLTHFANVDGSPVPYSKQSFDDAPLDQTELNNLVATCAFIHVNQSGHGICGCGQGDFIPAQPRAGR